MLYTQSLQLFIAELSPMSDMHVICAQAPRNLVLKSVFNNGPVLNQSDFVNTVLFVIFLFNHDMRFVFGWVTVGGGGGWISFCSVTGQSLACPYMMVASYRTHSLNTAYNSRTRKLGGISNSARKEGTTSVLPNWPACPVAVTINLVRRS